MDSNDRNKSIKKQQQQQPLHGQLISGCVAGGTSVLLLHPLDLLKTRFQATFDNDRALFNLRAQLTDLWKQGPRAMYRGFGANFAGSTVSWGLYFLLYKCMKNIYNDRHPYQIFLSSMSAGALTVLVANPLWMSKTRICQPNSQFTSLFTCLKTTWKLEGIGGWYKGLIAGLLGTSHGAVQFVVYEQLKRIQTRSRKMPSTLELLLMSSTSKFSASLATYPFQVIRCRFQLSDRKYNSMRELVYSTWKREGLRGFYKGFIPSTIRVLPSACVTFFVYEKLSTYFSSN